MLDGNHSEGAICIIHSTEGHGRRILRLRKRILFLVYEIYKGYHIIPGLFCGRIYIIYIHLHTLTHTIILPTLILLPMLEKKMMKKEKKKGFQRIALNAAPPVASIHSHDGKKKDE